MAQIGWSRGPLNTAPEDSTQYRARSRPLPLRVRTYSEAGSRTSGFNENRDGLHARNKSTNTIDNAHFSPQSPGILDGMDDLEETGSEDDSSTSSIVDSTTGFSDISSLAASPGTPMTVPSSHRSSLEAPAPEVITYDFSRIDYQLEQAKVLGEGLWSIVYLAAQQPVLPPRRRSILTSPTRRASRKSRTGSTPLLLAIKTPARKDAKDILRQEARVLSHLQRRTSAELYVVPFYGLDERNDSLVFEAVIGGSLEDLNNRMKQMTEVARHLELITLFPGIAYDLINGLNFLHSHGVIHADIKPGNILLDISSHTTHPHPVIRARYIDFSAAFIPDKGASASHAGGTWDFLSPEQLRIISELNTPTFASDIWSLGLTLLTLLVGASPYTAACRGNEFLLREAIKSADPIGFASMDPVQRKRLAACQDFVDCCRLALKKDRGIRVDARAWVLWLVESEWGGGV